MGLLQLYGKRLPVWREAGRAGTAKILSGKMEGMDLAEKAYFDWL
jgi:hypothetical protein